MKKICITLMLFAGSTFADFTYKGVVINSITSALLESVLVQLKGTTRQVYTDEQGRFSITSLTSISAPNHHTIRNYGFGFNTLSRTISWDAAFSASISIHDVLGRAVARHTKDACFGSYAIPHLNDCIYFLNLKIDGLLYRKKMVVMRNQVLMSVPLSNDYAPSAKVAVRMFAGNTDSLIFSKTGYIDKELVVADGDTNITVAMAAIVDSSSVVHDTLVDMRDGQRYKIVTIGTQTWMAQNLNVGIYMASTSSGSNVSNNGIIEKYAYDNETTYLATYGGLYDWDEAMGYNTTEGARGICPKGWHIPTDAEWKTLEIYLGMTQAEADMAWTWRGTDQGAQLLAGGSSGFKAFYTGCRGYGGGFVYLGSLVYFWCSSQYSAVKAWYRGINSGYTGVIREDANKTNGFCIRCLKDN